MWKSLLDHSCSRVVPCVCDNLDALKRTGVSRGQEARGVCHAASFKVHSLVGRLVTNSPENPARPEDILDQFLKMIYAHSMAASTLG